MSTTTQNSNNNNNKCRYKKMKDNSKPRNPKNTSNLNYDNHNKSISNNRKNNVNYKTYAFFFWDSIVKNLNGFLITKAIDHKHFVNVRQFSLTNKVM